MRFAIFIYSILQLSCLFPQAQSDSLRHILTQLQTEVPDQKLRQALHDLNALYLVKPLDDSLSLELLALSDLLVRSSIDKQKIFSYNLALAETLRTLSPQDGHICYAYSLDHLGKSYQGLGRFEEAVQIFQKSLSIKITARGEDHLDVASGLQNLGDMYFNLGQYDKVLPLYKRELAIKGKQLSDTSYEYADCLISLGWTYNYLGDYDTALLMSQQVLILIKKIRKPDLVEHANTLMNIARLYHRMGQYDRSMVLYEQALAMRKEKFGEDHFEYAVALIDVGYFYHKIIGNYEKALVLYEKALLIIENVSEKKDPGNASFGERLRTMHRLNLMHLGTVNYLLMRYQKAVSFYERVLRLSPRNITYLTNLALALHSTGQQDKSLALCNQISTILKGQNQTGLEYANGSKSLALLYYELGKYDSALPLYENYTRIIKQLWGKENLDYASGLNHLGMIHTAMGDPVAASLFDEATAITLKHLSRTYHSLSEQEKIGVFKQQSYQFDFLPSFLFLRNETTSPVTNRLYENVLALKGMVLEDQQAVLSSIRQSGDSRLLQLYFKWQKHKAFIGVQHLLPLVNQVPYFDSLENITNQLEQELSRSSLVFRDQQNNRAITANDISRKIPPGHAAVEFIRFQLYNTKWTDTILYSALLLLPGDSIAKFIPLFEEKQLQHLLRPYAGTSTGYYYIQRLYNGSMNPSATKNLRDSLYRLIWKPLETHLKGIHTIHYAPTGILHRIAFTALRDEASQLLIEKYQLNQVLSTRTVTFHQEESRKPLSAEVWGDIDYEIADAATQPLDKAIPRGVYNLDTRESVFNIYTNDTRGDRNAGWPSLLNTKGEIAFLKKTITKSGIAVSTVSGRSATEQVFKAMNGKSPQLLHIATHGFFLSVKANQLNSGNTMNSFTMQQNPMFRSGMVLAGGNHVWKGGKISQESEDGILTAYEIAQLDLSNTELVVLSACETALGETKHANEGVFGLQRAFKLAGVKTMIMSLWQVPDSHTAELMTLFYQNWMAGESIRKALHKAQMTMKKKYPSPFYWAAFIVVE